MNELSTRSTALASTRPRILVVDDDEAIRRMLGIVLGNLGCTVTLAESAASARRQLTLGSEHALVIMDVLLGRSSGLDLIAELRATLGPAAPPFILFSGGRELDVLPDGVVDLVTKPATVERLRSAVESALAIGRASPLGPMLGRPATRAGGLTGSWRSRARRVA